MAQDMTAKEMNVKDAEKNMRDIETKEGILNGSKRVSVFKGSEALAHLMNTKHLKTTEAVKAMTLLLEEHYIVRVRPDDDQYMLDVSYEFNVNHEYIWIVEGSQVYSVLMGIAALIGILAIAMFPIWPRSVKMASGYVFYGVSGIFILLIITFVVRLVVYIGVRMASGRSLWIFPNLYEDCGIIESFKPLYAWYDDKVNDDATDAKKEQ